MSEGDLRSLGRRSHLMRMQFHSMCEGDLRSYVLTLLRIFSAQATTMDVIKHKEESLFNEFFEVHRSLLQFQRFDGTMSPEVTRYSFTKWDAVGILVYHTTRESYILVRQMRYPPTHHGIDPWLTEIVAGGISPGEETEAAAFREVVEEIGYEPISIERVMQFYVSPGIMSERITLFYAEVDESSKINEGGGVPHEDEDIQLIWLPKSQVIEWIANQPVGDAKTIAALLWHFKVRS